MFTEDILEELFKYQGGGLTVFDSNPQGTPGFGQGANFGSPIRSGLAGIPALNASQLISVQEGNFNRGFRERQLQERRDESIRNFTKDIFKQLYKGSVSNTNPVTGLDMTVESNRALNSRILEAENTARVNLGAAMQQALNGGQFNMSEIMSATSDLDRIKNSTEYQTALQLSNLNKNFLKSISDQADNKDIVINGAEASRIQQRIKEAYENPTGADLGKILDTGNLFYNKAQLRASVAEQIDMFEDASESDILELSKTQPGIIETWRRRNDLNEDEWIDAIANNLWNDEDVRAYADSQGWSTPEELADNMVADRIKVKRSQLLQSELTNVELDPRVTVSDFSVAEDGNISLSPDSEGNQREIATTAAKEQIKTVEEAIRAEQSANERIREKQVSRKNEVSKTSDFNATYTTNGDGTFTNKSTGKVEAVNAESLAEAHYTKDYSNAVSQMSNSGIDVTHPKIKEAVANLEVVSNIKKDGLTSEQLDKLKKVQESLYLSGPDTFKQLNSSSIISNMTPSQKDVLGVFLANENLQDQFFEEFWLPNLEQEANTLLPGLNEYSPDITDSLFTEDGSYDLGNNYEKHLYLLHHHGLPKATEFLKNGFTENDPSIGYVGKDADDALKKQFKRIDNIKSKNTDISINDLFARLESDSRGHLSVNSKSSALGKHQILGKSNFNNILQFINSKGLPTKTKDVSNVEELFTDSSKRLTTVRGRDRNGESIIVTNHPDLKNKFNERERFVASPLFGEDPFIESLSGEQIKLPKNVGKYISIPEEEYLNELNKPKLGDKAIKALEKLRKKNG